MTTKATLPPAAGMHDQNAPSDAYERDRARWEALWRDSFGQVTIEVEGWSSPWLDESWRDGNPIFSAWSAALGRGIRVLQHDEPGPFAYWEDTFGDGPDEVAELVIACAPTSDALRRAAALWTSWAAGRSPRTAMHTTSTQQVVLAQLPEEPAAA